MFFKIIFATQLHKKMRLFAPVKIGKVFISLFLLMSYIIGYAHELLPHHQEMDAVEQSVINIDGKHHHHNHTSPSETKENKRLVSHQNHFDEGVLDLLVCLINEVEHQENDCNLDFYDLAKPEMIIKNDQVKTRFVAIFAVVLNLNIQIGNEGCPSIGTDIFYHAPPIIQSPNRGPPTLV